MGNTIHKLGDMPKHAAGKVVGFDTDDDDLETRLREIGFAEGDPIQPLHYGLFGRNPMSVLLNGAIIALRRREANAILVEILPGV